MGEVMLEPRAAVMILVQVSWQDRSGALQTIPACMEDKSVSGACIRVKTRIGVGSKLSIQWRWDQFSGIAKNCRSEGREYLVGVQRDTTKSPISNRPVPTDMPRLEEMRSREPLISTNKIQSLPQLQESKPSEIPIADGKVESVPIVGMASDATAMPARPVGHEIDRGERPRISQPQDFDVLRRTELQTKQPPTGKEAGKERKHMGHKWLELAPWRNKQDSLNESGNGNTNSKVETENRAPRVASPIKKTPADPAREGVANFQVELLPMADIYRAAGIMSPRRGYSINKVVEMLNSEHIRGLSKEMKRAALLMALNAAGILIGEVLQDAKGRQQALDAYEAEQKKQVEAEWARKEEENVQIEAELERVKAQYMTRISRNLDGVAREKATFTTWLAMKQQECQSISEAAELCLKSTAPEPASVSRSDVSMVGASAKPV